MISLKEALVHKHMDRPKKHRNYWVPDKSMYTDPEDIIAMFLSRKCIIHDKDGNYIIPIEDNVNKIKNYIKNKQSMKLITCLNIVPIDTYAYEQAQDILEKEGWKFEYQNIDKLLPGIDWGAPYCAVFLKD